MQQAPGQHELPQQPALLDEIVVALVTVSIAAIKSRYFMIPSCLRFLNPRLRQHASTARVLCRAERYGSESNPRGRSWWAFSSCRCTCVLKRQNVASKTRGTKLFRERPEKNQRRARNGATTGALAFALAWLMIGGLLLGHFASRHLGAATGGFRHPDHVRFGHFRAEKSK